MAKHLWLAFIARYRTIIYEQAHTEVGIRELYTYLNSLVLCFIFRILLSLAMK